MNQKGFAPVLILVAVVLVAALAGGVYYFGRAGFEFRLATPVATLVTPTPTPQQDETANWKTYTNAGYDYSLKYPTNLIVDDKDDASVWVGKQIVVMVSDIGPDECRGPCPVVNSRNNVAVNGLAAVRKQGYIGAIGGDIPQSYEEVTIQHDDRFYTLTVYELERDDATQPPTREIKAVPEESVDTFNKILSTFRFD